MVVGIVLIGLALLVFGYSLGRLGHVYFGHWKCPHHWIYGILLISMGVYIGFDKAFLTLALVSLGTGCFVSDISDFAEFNIICPDTSPERKFFGFD